MYEWRLCTLVADFMRLLAVHSSSVSISPLPRSNEAGILGSYFFLLVLEDYAKVIM